MKYLSLVAIFAIFTSVASADSANSIKDAISNGEFSGDFGIYGENFDNNGETKDSGFSMATFGAVYESQSLSGFKVQFGGRATANINEKNDGDFWEFDEDGNEFGKKFGVVSLANVYYENSFLQVRAGRQEIDFEWIGDFHDATVATLKPLENLELTLGYTKKMMEVNDDSRLYQIQKINDNDGLYFFDGKLEQFDSLTINPYFYSAKEISKWYGVKVDFDKEIFGVGGQISKSNEEAIDAQDGLIYCVEARGKLQDFSLNTGYIRADKDGGIGSMDMVGDNINLFEEGNQVYAKNGKTVYLGGEYEFGSFVFGALYGQTKYDEVAEDGSKNSSLKEKELNFGVEYKIVQDLTIGAIYANVEADEKNNDYDKISAKFSYSF